MRDHDAAIRFFVAILNFESVETHVVD
jgi:hypothetical protein